MGLREGDPEVLGEYRIVDRLGAGGMGVVYRARSRSGREVAVKVVHDQYAADAVFRARFRQEIAAARRVSGAFTAPVVDADPDAERPWMATQYVPGRSLAARVRDDGPLTGTELRRLALGLVEALRDIHRAGVVHRDLKPANVLMADDGPRVIDFGISRAAGNQQLTETGHMMGTPPFMSPEQLTDARTVGPASDVFSLAALLTYAATGRGPFDADSPYISAYKVLTEEPALTAVPEPLHDVLARCLTKDPATRPALAELAPFFAEALSPGEWEEPETVSRRVPDPVRTVLPGAVVAPEESAGELPTIAPAPGGPQAAGFSPDRARTNEPRPGELPTVAPSPAAPSPAASEPPPIPGTGTFRAVPDSITPAGSHAPAPRTPARRRRRMPLLAGVTGVLAVALTVYLVGSLNTKGTVGTEPSAGPTATRWAALPKGWRAWQTTLFATAETGVREAPERGTSRGPDPQPSCVEGGGAVYCVGVGVLPAKVDATTGRTLWRARPLPEGTSVDRYGAQALGVRDDALLLVETITNEAANDTASRVTAYAVADGRRLWTRPVDERYVDAVLLGDTVLVGDGTATTARSPRDGTKLWTATPLAGYRCDYREAGDALYADCVNYHTASGADRVLFAVSATDGTTRRLNSAPPVHAVYAGDLDGSLLYAAQEGEDDGAYTKTVLIDPTADTARTTPLGEPLQGWPVLVHGVLCAAESSGRVTAVSPRTGARLWQTATTLEQPSTPVADTLRSLFVTTASGRIAALDAQTGTALWESYPRAARVSGTVTTIPTLLLHQGALVVPTPDGSLFSIDPANPGK